MKKIEEYPGKNKAPLSKMKHFTDFKIESEDGVEIPCHRVFLASRSNVFFTMFESQMKEASEGKIKLNYNSEVLQSFVDFFYESSVKADILLKYHEEFLNLSEQYDLELLKLLTEYVLIKNLSVQNMAEYFMLADLFNAQELRDAARKFLINNKDCFKEDDYLTNQLKTFDADRIFEIMKIVL